MQHQQLPPFNHHHDEHHHHGHGYESEAEVAAAMATMGDMSMRAAGDGGGNDPSPSQQPQQQQQQLTRRQKAMRGLLAKIDSIYTSVHALEATANLIADTCSYLEVFSNDMKQQKGRNVDYEKALQLPCDCLRFAIEGLDQHGAIISQAIVNSSDVKMVASAQRKLFKNRKGTYAQQINPNVGSKATNRAMERDPKVALQISFDYAKETLEWILEKTDSDFVELAMKARKKRKRKGEEKADNGQEDGKGAKKSKGDNSTDNDDGDGKSEDQKDCKSIEVIDLPAVMEGRQYYSPIEAVTYIQNIIESDPGNSYIRAYKEEIIAKKLIPVRIQQLNSLVKKYGGADKPMAPLKWKTNYPEPCWDVLLSKFQEKQKRGLSWSIDETREALTSYAKEENQIDPIDDEIQRHHAALCLFHNMTNHMNRQIVLQERRLKENPPVIPKIPRVPKPNPTYDNFDKNNEKYKDIHLPKPSGNNLMYTPAEAVEHIWKFKNRNPNPPGPIEVRTFKEKMIAERIIPVSIKRLNQLMKKHGGPGKEPAPKSWNQRGRQELIPIEDLVKIVNDSQMRWTLEDTCNLLWAEKRRKFAKDGEDVKCPLTQTVHAYHTALLSIPELAGRVVKPEIIPIKPGPRPKNNNNC